MTAEQRAKQAEAEYHKAASKLITPFEALIRVERASLEMWRIQARLKEKLTRGLRKACPRMAPAQRRDIVAMFMEPFSEAEATTLLPLWMRVRAATFRREAERKRGRG